MKRQSPSLAHTIELMKLILRLDLRQHYASPPGSDSTEDRLHAFFWGKGRRGRTLGLRAMVQLLQRREDGIDVLGALRFLRDEGPNQRRRFVQRYMYQEVVTSFRECSSHAKRVFQGCRYQIPSIPATFLGEEPALLAQPRRRHQIRSVIARFVLDSDTWLDLVRSYDHLFPGWDAVRKNDTARKQDLLRRFKTHTSLAAQEYQNEEWYGLAAALHTLSGEEGDHASWYQLARAVNAAVPLDCCDSESEKYADLVRTGPLIQPFNQRTVLEGFSAHLPRDMSCGDEWKPDINALNKSWMRGALAIDRNNMVTTSYAPQMEIIVRGLLSNGRWRTARLLTATTSWIRQEYYGKDREDFCVSALMAMTVAAHEGRFSIAAALGQIVLSDHQRHLVRPTAGGKSGLQYVVDSIIDSEKENGLISSENRSKELRDHFLKQIHDLFDGVIARGERLELETV